MPSHLKEFGRSWLLRIARAMESFRNSTRGEIGNRELTQKSPGQQHRELLALSTIVTSITSTLSFEQVLDEILASVKKLIPRADSMTIQLVDREAGNLITLAATGGISARQRRIEFKLGEGIVGQVVINKRLINSPDVLIDPEFVRGPIDPPYRSLLVTPLLFGDQALGALSLESCQPEMFSKADERLAESFARYAAIAIENANLYKQAQQEITERKLAESKMRESEARTRAILDTAADGILTFDEDGIVTDCNFATEQIFGYRADEIIGQHFSILIPEFAAIPDSTQPEKFPRIDWVRILGKSHEVQAKRKGDKTFPIDLAVREVALDERRIFTSIVRDISERVEARQALQHYSERLEEMVDERTQELRSAQEQLLAQRLLQQELDLARQIQESLLPEQVPEMDGFEFAATAHPARYVSGDLYDFNLADGGTCQIVLADIAGKGMPAALLASTVRASLRAESEHHKLPAAILSKLNQTLFQDLSRAEVFVTLFIAQADANTGRIEYASAGHSEALLWRNLENQFEDLFTTGLPMGIFYDEVYTKQEISLRPGDIFLIYSDGVTDATNAAQEYFGLDRLSNLICHSATLSASDLSDEIVRQVQFFSGEQDQVDDISVLVIKAMPRTVALEVPGTLENLDRLMSMIGETTAVYSDEFAYEIELTCSEIATNIIKHAYNQKSGNIRLEIHLQSDGVQLDFFDDGEAFDISKAPKPDLYSINDGGYGISIVKQIVDALDYEPGTDLGNHWRLVKYIHG